MVCVISLDRYVAIVLATKYQKLLTRKRGYAIVAAIWTAAIILSIPPLIGWSSYQYHPGTLHCSPVWVGQCPYFYFTFTLSVIIPTTLTVLSYIIIFWRIRQHRKRVAMWKNAGKCSGQPTSTTDESGLELSQIPTVHKSPGIVRKDSEVINIQNTADEDGVEASSKIHKHTPKSSLMTTPVITRRSSSWGVVVEEQITMEQTAYPQRRTFILDSDDTFYNPSADASPEPEATSPTQMIAEVVQNGELQNSSSELKHSLLEAPKKGLGNVETKFPEAKLHDGTLLIGKDSSKDEDSLAKVQKVVLNKDSQKKHAKKSSIGRLLTENRGKKSRKLSNKDVNGLLNLSEGNDAPSSSTLSSDNRSRAGMNSLIDENKNACEIGQQNAESNTEKAKRHGKRRKIRVSFIGGDRKSKQTPNRKSLRRSTSKMKRASSTLQEFQVAKTGAILLVVFMVCYGPYTIVHLCHLPFPVPEEAQYFAMWCVFLNSILTPIIYGIMNKETRTKMKLVLKKCWCCS